MVYLVVYKISNLGNYDIQSLKQYKDSNSRDDLYRFNILSEYCVGDVLDVGCGPALLKNYISDNCYKYVGLDVNGQIDIHASVYNLPFKNDTFDTVVMSEVLEHLEHPLDALKEIKRVSRSRIIASVPNPYSVQQLYTIFMHRHSMETENHILAFSDGEINQICKRLDLKIDRRIPTKFREPLFGKYMPFKTKRFAAYLIYLIGK